MAGAKQLIQLRNLISVPSSYPAQSSSLKPLSRIFRIRSARKNDMPQNIRSREKKSSKIPRRLIRLSTAQGKWQGDWTCEYVFSLQELCLEDLVEDEQKNAQVSISLIIQKHASFGLSVDGRIITSFTRNCSNCSSPYCKEINKNFKLWVLHSNADGRGPQLPEIGGDDPSVIYVKPGYEANLDPLIQDTIRLTISVNDTCSELCEKSEATFHSDIGVQNTATLDKRWSKLLKLRNAIQ